MAGSVCTAERPSRHQNVNGFPIVLHKRSIGKSLCMEYTVKKETLPLLQCKVFYTFSVCIGLLSLSVCLSSVPGIVFFTLSSIALFYIRFWDVEKEILLVTVSVGLQFTAFCKSGQQTTCFIPWHCIKDVYIVEAISLHRVLYNLMILTESKEHEEKFKEPSRKLIPLFQGTQPRLSCLESIYRSIHSLLPEIDNSTSKLL